MFKSWQQSLSPATATSTPDAKSMSPSLRADIYTALELVTPWLVGPSSSSSSSSSSFSSSRHSACAGDGVSYQPILALVRNHFPDLSSPGIDAIGHVEPEVALVVAGITNMVLEMSKWDGMAGAMTMRTWVDALTDALARIDASAAGRQGGGGAQRREHVGRGITRGINQLTDVSLMTRAFAARIQIISLLKSVNTKVHGHGTEEARQGEALWSSKFI